MSTYSQGKPLPSGVFFSFLALMALLYTGCSEGLLLSEGDATAKSLSTPLALFNAGHVQKASERLELRLDGIERGTWTVSVISSSQATLYSTTMEATAKNPATLKPEIWKEVLKNKDVTPRLVLSGQVVVAGKKPVLFRTVFYLFRDIPQLTVSTVPVEVEPEAWLGSQAYLSDQVGAALPASGYIVWKVSGVPLAEGNLADRSLFWWKADSQPGTTEMTAEWYPEAPSRDPLDGAPAAVSVVSRPVVTATPKPLSGELVPEASYSSLWHFRGTLVDRISGERLSSTGKTEPSWVLNNGSLAAWVSAETILSGHQPEFLAKGLVPFTINMNLRPGETNRNSLLWQTLDSNAAPVLQLSLKAGKRLVFRVYSGLAFQESDSGIDLPNEFSSASLSVFLSKKDWNLVWYRDGSFVRSERLLASRGLPERLEGRNVALGGEVWWEELGIYTKAPSGIASTDPEVFARAQETRYGSDLVLAQGFDGIELPAGWAVPALNSELAAQLHPGQSVASPLTTIPGGKLRFPFRSSDSSPGSLTIQVLDSESKVVWKGVNDGKTQEILWDRKEPRVSSARIEWKNTGASDISLDELTIIRKIE